jgi:DNA repair photolyase
MRQTSVKSCVSIFCAVRLSWHNAGNTFYSERALHYAEYKTILSPKNGMNLYRGCTHGCIYCDARSACYQMKHDFEDIEVKQNAAAILEAQLLKKRRPCMIGTGAMCDPYIHLEEELRLTRQCVELIERHGFGLAIQTKSARILRDLDLLKSINARAKCVVQMTLTTCDEALCRIVEPNVSTTAERFAALEIFRDAGIPTVVWISPILPFINDSEENLRGIMDYCIRAKVKGIICFGFGTTLREGRPRIFPRHAGRAFSRHEAKIHPRLRQRVRMPKPEPRAALRDFLRRMPQARDSLQARRCVWIFARIRAKRKTNDVVLDSYSAVQTDFIDEIQPQRAQRTQRVYCFYKFFL